MKKTLFWIIISLFTTILFASDANEAFLQAQNYEKNGDIQNAMKYYKKAASLSLMKAPKPYLKDNDAIVKYGNNTIESYDNNITDNTIKQIIYSKFNIQAYRTNYLLPFTYDRVNHPGREHFETKFQVSLKKELSHNLLGLDEKIYGAYTQISWWQTSADSSPFRETNYEPEVFMAIPYGSTHSPFKAYKIGLTHQSNGQGGTKSRSWNRAYLSGIFQYGGVFFEPRAWYRFKEGVKTSDGNGDDNPDIQDYLGYGDLKIAYPYQKNLISILLRNNLKFNDKNKGAVQLDWTFPFPWINDAYGYIQIFNGYGESLIDYNKRSQRISVGFAVTR